MHFLLILLIALFFQNCSSSYTEESQDNLIEKIKVVSNSENNIFEDNFEEDKAIYDKVFPWIKDSTYYKNPNLLIQKLGEYYDQNTQQSSISSYQQQRLYGLQDSIWFLNCKSAAKDSSCAYPSSSTQYLFDKEGKLLYKNTAIFTQFIPIMPDSLALYMSVEQDCEGNGNHHLYRYQHGELIDIFNTLMNDSPKTVDANPEGGMFQNNFLSWIVSDLDEDGYNDVTLKGKWLVLENEAGNKRLPSNPFQMDNIEYKFLYKPTKEYFLLEK